MYNYAVETSRVISLGIYAKQVAKLSRILKYPEGEKRIDAIGRFLKGLSNEEQAFSTEVLVKNCRAYCSFNMNETCFAQEVLSEELRIKRTKEGIQDELKGLKELLKEADKLTTTVKKMDNERRKALSNLVREKKYKELNLSFQEIAKIIEMACTTEISLPEANREFRIVSRNLNTLGEYLKKIK